MYLIFVWNGLDFIAFVLTVYKCPDDICLKCFLSGLTLFFHNYLNFNVPISEAFLSVLILRLSRIRRPACL